MKQYVAGFLFNIEATVVVLVEKRRPALQRGLWNAVGGKIEVGETPEQAMRREFREETGFGRGWWEHYATLSGETFQVVYFRAFAEWTRDEVRTMTDEQIAGFLVSDLPKTLANTRWLLEMALREVPGRGMPYTIQEAVCPA